MQAFKKRALSLLAVLLPVIGWGHGTVVLSGEVERQAGGVLSLVVNIDKGSLGFYARQQKDYATWGQLRGDAALIEKLLKNSILLEIGTNTLMKADESAIRALRGKYPPKNEMELPDEVQLTLIWREVSDDHQKLASYFEDTPIHVQLKLSGERSAGVTVSDPHGHS